MKKTTSEKLANNLEYFTSNTSKRCINSEGSCKYSGTTLGIKTKGCFIGTLLPPQTRKRADERKVAGVMHLIECASRLGYKLPSIITENPDLMQYFQNLHDVPKYWDKEGLTEGGKTELNRIVLKYRVLNLKDFEKFTN